MYTRVQRDISMIVSLKIYAFVKIKDQWKLSRWRQLSLRFTLTPALNFFHVDVSSQFVSRWHQLSNSFTLTSALKSFHAYISSQFLSRWRHISNPVMVTSALKSFQGDTSPKIRWRWRQLSSFFHVDVSSQMLHVDISSQIISRWRQLSNHFMLTSAFLSIYLTSALQSSHWHQTPSCMIFKQSFRFSWFFSLTNG
jgi:hypothetical protein